MKGRSEELCIDKIISHCKKKKKCVKYKLVYMANASKSILFIYIFAVLNVKKTEFLNCFSVLFFVIIV